jgi:hypothetical protein
VKRLTVHAACRTPRTLIAVKSATAVVMVIARPRGVPTHGANAARYAASTLSTAPMDSSRVHTSSQPTWKPSVDPNASRV